MMLIDSIAEERITHAIRAGDLDNLSGMGKPLALEDDSGIPETLRVGYRILRNAGCLPPELTLRNDIKRLENLLDQAELAAEEQAIRRRLCLLKTRMAMHGRDSDLLVRDHAYRERLLYKLTRESNHGVVETNDDAGATLTTEDR